jgi:ribosomal protein S4E
MTYNVIDDLSKLRITFPFMEVVKIPQQRENLLRILDDSDTRMEVAVINSKQQQMLLISQVKRKSPTILHYHRKS